MKNFVLSITLLLSVNFSFAQNVRIAIVGDNEKKASLASLSGEKISFIDSIKVNERNEFNFSLANHHLGIYRLTFDKNTWLDFIYDNEDIEIETNANNILDSLQVNKSESNMIYYEFIKLNKDYKTKSELLQLILARYPKEDSYYKTSKEKLIQVQEDYLYFVNATAQANPNSFVARYVRSAQLPVMLGTTLALMVGPELFRLTTPTIRGDPRLFIGALLMAPAFAALASCLPAILAATQDPAAVLREG